MSTFGTLFKVSTFGESHGKGVGCIVDGVPPNMELTEADIQTQLTRRRPGQSVITTERKEFDKVTILSGTEFGKTLGTPICMVVMNEDQRKHDYATTDVCPRPGHAEYTYLQKYGCKASSGGGRSSARETIGRVAAGALAEKYLAQTYGTQIVCWVSSIMDIEIPKDEARALEERCPSREEVDTVGAVIHGEVEKVLMDSNGDWYDLTGKPIAKKAGVEVKGAVLHTRCPHPPTAARMAARIMELRIAEDSTGGIATTVIKTLPAGLGEPVFDKVEAELAKAMMSLPATKGFEIGAGFGCTRMKGSEHNDLFVPAHGAKAGVLDTATNHAGGTLGGITTGKPLVLRVAIKPASSIAQSQQTATYDGKESALEVKGRHDPCVLSRCPPLLEGMAAITILDLVLRQKSRTDAPLHCAQLTGEERELNGRPAKRAKHA